MFYRKVLAAAVAIVPPAGSTVVAQLAGAVPNRTSEAVSNEPLIVKLEAAPTRSLIGGAPAPIRPPAASTRMLRQAD